MIKLKLSEDSLRMRNKKISVFLSGVLALNTVAMINVKANGPASTGTKDLSKTITDKAVSFIKSQKNENGSFGNCGLVNDTAESMTALRASGETVPEESKKWAEGVIKYDNTDISSRLAASFGNAEYLLKMEAKQNTDGGFGLFPEYGSDVLDSVLVLEAVNDANYSSNDLSGTAICSYLMNSVNKDGGFSYTEASDSDDILTSMVVYNVGRYLSANNFDVSVLEPSLSYLESKSADDYSDSGIRKTLWKYLAEQAVNKEIDYYTIVQELDKAEKSDGSFAENIEATSVAVRLLSGIDFENRIDITAFDTVLSSNNASAEQSSTISGKTFIGYTSNSDAELDLKITLYNGKTVVEEQSLKVLCKADGNAVEADLSEFKLAEPDGENIFVLAELSNKDRLLKSQRIDINFSSAEPNYATEVSELNVELDKRAVLINTDAEVNVSYDLLYASNVESSVQIKTIVTKDGKEIESTVRDVTLVPEKNHIKDLSLTFKPDTSAVGTYEVSVGCYVQGNEVLRTITDLEVSDQPVIIEKLNAEDDTQFEVNWFGPVLSDYYVYAGNETEINAGAEINYYSNDVYNGKIKLEVSEKDNIIAETSFDAVIEKGEIKYFDGKAEFPIYSSGDQLTFKVKNVGEYIINAKLFDSEGNLIKEGSRTLKVVDRPQQSLILNSAVSGEKSDMIDMTWNDISNDAESYSYQLYRKTNNSTWEPRSIWNEEENIKVLNVYPYMPYLEEWMTTTLSETETPAGMEIFDIDSVHINEFNTEPDKFLLNQDGSWKYDVIFFGAADSNSNIDLNDASYAATSKFIDSGRGVLFGHDTIGQNVFNRFAERAGLMIGVWNISRTTSVSVVKTGTLTNYPWDIKGDLTVPNTHSTAQYIVDATEWITLNNSKYVYPDTGYTDGFYLCTKDNLGMIQTGDSTGQATDDERKILANTLFYLYQISQQTTAKDASFYDIDAPDIPTVISSKNEGGKAVINVGSADNATEYEYYISANPANSEEESVLSNVVRHTALSGLAGFTVKLDPSSEPKPELIEYNENNVNVIGIVKADENGRAVIEIEPDDFSEQQYIHIYAVDNANNVSEEYILPFADSEISTSINTDKKIYSYGEKVKINADTVSMTFGRTADMSITIYDESDGKTAELLSEKGRHLDADIHSADTVEWEIPVETAGRYKASIVWYKGEKKIAEAETSFRVENEKSVSNFIASDKKNYSLTDPVNITGDVSNNSSAMTENDLVLDIKLYDSTNNEIMSFSHNVGSLNPDAYTEHSDAVAPGKLSDGNYLVKATVKQDDVELSSDTAEFTVSGETVFSGSLDLTSSGQKGNAEFSVKNTGQKDAEEAEITVNVYKVDTNELVYTYAEPASIKAGETITGNTAFDLDNNYDGDYSAVLTVLFKGSSYDLDYDGIIQEKTETGTTSVSSDTTSKTTSATTAKPAKTTSKRSNSSPGTGDNAIPAYMWMISIFSLAGIVILRRKGGNEDNE